MSEGASRATLDVSWLCGVKVRLREVHGRRQAMGSPVGSTKELHTGGAEDTGTKAPTLPIVPAGGPVATLLVWRRRIRMTKKSSLGKRVWGPNSASGRHGNGIAGRCKNVICLVWKGDGGRIVRTETLVGFVRRQQLRGMSQPLRNLFLVADTLPRGHPLPPLSSCAVGKQDSDDEEDDWWGEGGVGQLLEATGRMAMAGSNKTRKNKKKTAVSTSQCIEWFPTLSEGASSICKMRYTVFRFGPGEIV